MKLMTRFPATKKAITVSVYLHYSNHHQARISPFSPCPIINHKFTFYYICRGWRGPWQAEPLRKKGQEGCDQARHEARRRHLSRSNQEEQEYSFRDRQA